MNQEREKRLHGILDQAGMPDREILNFPDGPKRPLTLEERIEYVDGRCPEG